MTRTIPLIALALVLAGCACCAPPPSDPDFSRPLGHEDDGHLQVIVLGTIDRGDAVEYVLYFSPAERPTQLLEVALLRAEGEPVVTKLHEHEARGEVHVRFPQTDQVTRVGVRYESPNGVRRTLLVSVQR